MQEDFAPVFYLFVTGSIPATDNRPKKGSHPAPCCLCFHFRKHSVYFTVNALTVPEAIPADPVQLARFKSGQRNFLTLQA
ncbi:hypothetical protein, partial [Mixta sp. Marseille-Q2659]|uniref:hypothetical protein n=1 Tax=Mixta sp. Marseille-Q2659 TaxID=2736607 RepID=UPI0023B9516A